MNAVQQLSKLLQEANDRPSPSLLRYFEVIPHNTTDVFVFDVFDRCITYLYMMFLVDVFV